MNILLLLPRRRPVSFAPQLTLLLLVGWLFRPGALNAQCLTYQAPGLYSFTVPSGGPFTIRITTKGGDGGSSKGGSGASAIGSFVVRSGDQLTTIVGEVGHSYNNTGGGGGGTAVILSRGGSLSLLVAAGGGGGANPFYDLLGGGGRGTGYSGGGAGGIGSDFSGGGGGGGGGGGLDAAGTDGTTGIRNPPGGGGGQASLTTISPGGNSFAGSVNGGSGFGGGGGSSIASSGGVGGGGGYGGGRGGDARNGANTTSQGGYSYLSPTASAPTITPGANASGQQQNGFVNIEYPNNTATATITSRNTSICAGQSTTITGTINATGTWTIILSDGTTKTGTGSTFSIPVTPPSSTTYTIQCLFDANGVALAGSVSGSTIVTLNPSSPPIITQQPVSGSSVVTGTTVVASARFSGRVNTFQWYKDGTPVAGQTSPDLRLDNVTFSQAGSYSLVATGDCNSVTTTAFSLNVATPASISGTKTVAGSFTPGGAITYTIVLTNSGQFTQADNPDDELTDLLPSSLTLTSASASSGRVQTSGGILTWNGSLTGGGSVTITIGATLNANTPAGQTILNQATIRYDGDGNGTNDRQTRTDDPAVGGIQDATSFTVACPPLSVSLANNGPLSCTQTSVTLTAGGGAVGDQYRFGGGASQVGSSNQATVGGAGVYSVTLITASGCTATASTTVTGSPPPPTAITQQPVSGSSVCAGTVVTASVSTSGSVTGYQWYQNGNLVSGQTSATLTLPNATTAQSGSYSVVVTGSCSSVTSTAFNLTVTPLSPDYQPLVDLYNSTNGPNWYINTNWLTGCTPCNWFGVSCDGNGRVIALDLEDNSLFGRIPASLGNLANLRSLTLRSNQLSGSVPASLGNLTSLQNLNFYANDLSGPIPASLGNLTNLQTLDFYNNQLSGSVPASLGNLTDLQTLDLSANALSGPIPASLGNLTNLQLLNLKGNQLSGCFPASLSALCGVPYVDLSSNRGLPGEGDFGAFCNSGAGSDAFAPLATASPNPVCVGSPVSLSVSAGTSYAWSGPAGFTATTQTPTFTPTSAASSGVYSVTVGNGSATCTATTSVSLTVNPLPVAGLINNGPLSCAQTSVTLTASGGTSYTFASGSGPLGTPGPTNTVSVSSTGSYSVTVANGGGCTSTASTTVTGDQTAPTVSISPSSATLSCTSPSVSLTAVGTGSVHWSTGETTPVISVSVAGPYSATLTSANGCSAMASANVTSTTVTLTVSSPLVTTALQGQSFNQAFTAARGLSPYNFSLSSGSLPLGLSLSPTGVVSGTPTQAGSFTIVVRATDQNGCTGSSAGYRLTVNEPRLPIRYVKPVASGTGNGDSWVNASGDLQAMIIAPGVEQVWVAAGTYKPNGTNRTISFYMKEAVAIYGGFVGTETTLNQRPMINPVGGQPSSTTLSGDIATPGDNSDNVYHVISNYGNYGVNLTSRAVLDGFVITGGGGAQGGGIFNVGSNPTITNCSLVGNAGSQGGGIYNSGCSPTLTTLLFETNAVTGEGGALFNTSSNPVLTNCRFQNNQAGNFGGAVYNVQSSPSLTNCVLQANLARLGGGIAVLGSSQATLINCALQSNTATSGGGVFFIDNSNPVSTNCSFLNNVSTNSNGGILVAQNNGLPVFTNCVVYGNGGSNTFRAPIRATYCLFENTVTNYPADPTNRTTSVSPFVSAGSVGLNACALAINAGSNDAYSAVSGPSTDLSGNARIVGGVIDMGAVEFQGTPNIQTAFTQLPTSATGCVGSSLTIPFSVSGTGPFSVQLYRQGVAVGPSQSSTVLSFTNLQPADAGSYQVVVTGTCNSVTSTAFSVVVNAPPVARLTNNGPLSCTLTSVTLTALGGTSYTFASGNGVLGTPGPTNTVVVSSTGSYSVTVANAGGCVSTTSTTVAGDQTAPTVSIRPSSTTLSCASPSVSLTAVGSGTLRWSTGETTPVISVSVAGPYSVTLTGPNGCSAVASVIVGQDNAAPLASLVSSGTLSCALTSVTLTVSPNGQTYVFSSGATQIGTSNQAVVSTSGTYSVTVVSANGCSALTSVSVGQDQTAPVASLVSSGSLSCSVTSVTLTASPNGLTYQFSSGATQVGSSNQAVVNTSGIYSVTVISTNGCSSVASTTVIGDVSVPMANLTNNGPISCSMTSVTLTASGGSTYRFGSGSNQIGSSPTATVSSAGIYSVTVVGSNGCTATASTTVVGDVGVPTASLTNNGPISCSTTSVTLTAGGGSSYRFSSGASQIGNNGPTATVTTAGIYSVTVISTNGCSSTASTTVVGDVSVPVASLVNNGPISCSITSVTLTASGGSTYRFSAGAAQLSNSPTATVATAGVYSVTVISGNGCSAVASTTVTGDQSVPTAVLTNNGPISCSMTSVTLTASGGNSYQFSSAASQIGSGPTATVSTAGVYSVTVIGGNGCSSVASTTVASDQSMPVVTIAANPSLTIAQGQSTLLTASVSDSQPLIYTWSTNQTTPAIAVTTAGPYSVTVVGSNGCSATASVVVSVTMAPVVSSPFAITGVGLLSCTPINEFRKVISIQPRYDGLNGSPVSFSVANELRATTDGGPYTLQLYIDNPTITLQAVQSGVVTRFAYNWLAACNSGVTLPPSVTNTAPTLVSPVIDQTVTAGGYFSLNLANTFSDAQTPNGLVLSASGLPAGLSLSGTTLSGIAAMSGVSTITLTATDPGGLSVSTGFMLTVLPAPAGNTAPTVVNPVGSQTATTGQFLTLSVSGVFTDAETPNALTLSTAGLPAGLSLTGTIISGTPSLSGTSTVVLTATDGGNLSTSTRFVFTVTPPTSPTSGGSFAIVGVSTISCTPIVAGRIDISFTPQYAGLNGSPVTFSVANELAATAAGGPYSLQLYVDNPTITLQALQSGVASSFAYNWLAACNSGGNPPPTPGNTAPRVVQAVSPQSTTVGQSYMVSVANVFTDTETPNSLVLTASGLPAGLSLTGTSISGTPSLSGTATVVLTATDSGSLSASTSFVLMVSPADSVTTSPPSAGFSITGVQTLSCVTAGSGQRSVTFMPQYGGLTGQAITFAVVNELAPTTAVGPYTLRLYTDNPSINLKATQAGSGGESGFSYNWLAACNSGNTRQSAEPVADWQVIVLGNPVVGETVVVEVRGAGSESLQLETLSEQGYPVDRQGVESARAVERFTLRVGSWAGVYLVRVISPFHSQTLKLIKR